MLATRNTSQARTRGLSGSPGAGTSASLPATSARCSVIAALSVITLPSGSNNVGTCATGLIGPSRARAAAEANRSSTSSIVNGNPYQANCASTSTEPQPRRPKSLYIAPTSTAPPTRSPTVVFAALFDGASGGARGAADVGALLGDAGFLEADPREGRHAFADDVL